VELWPNAAQWEFEQHCGKRNIVLKARQLGITTWVAARFFIHTITRPGTLSVQVAHDQESAEAIFRIVHRYLENLPEWLRYGALATSRSNVRQIVFPRLDSEYRVETAADPNAGRGLTIQNLHCSEVARWPGDGAETLSALRAAVAPGGEIVLESTPNGAGGCFYDEWQRADETGYVRHFFPWWLESSYLLPALEPLQYDDEERALIERIGLLPEQIAYRRGLRGEYRRLARQEYAEDPHSCFLASGECVFDVDAIESRLTVLDGNGNDLGAWLRDGHCDSYRQNGSEVIFWPPTYGKQYIVGVDPAGGGIDGDFACAEVIERSSGLQCAELYGHYPPRELAREVAHLGHQFNNALIAVERNNHGHAVLAQLNTAEHYPHIYLQKGQQGWLTNVATRPKMIEEFAALLAVEPGLFYSPRLLQECRTFVRHEDGSTSANSGAHDDCVMAMAIAQAVRGSVQPSAVRRQEKLLALSS